MTSTPATAPQPGLKFETAPPPASAPLADWIDWMKAEYRLTPDLNLIYRLQQTKEFSGYKKTMIEEKITLAEFPAPFALSDQGRAIGWDFLELLAWKLWRMARRDAAAGVRRDHMADARAARKPRKGGRRL